MRRLLWIGAWSAVVVWSLVAFAAYNVIDAAGALAMRNADSFSADPETVEWIFSVFGWLRSASTSIALVVWGVVSLIILSVPWLLDRLLGRGSVVVRTGTTGPFPGAGFQPRRPDFGGRQEGVIDLDPDQYTVRPAPGSPPPDHSSPVPRIPPR